MSEHGEPWHIEKSPDFRNVLKYNKAIVKHDGSAIRPNDRPRIVACVNFLAGVPTDRLTALTAAGDITLVSLMLSYIASGDDTPLAMLHDELQSRLDSIKADEHFYTREELLNYIRKQYKIGIHTYPDLRPEARRILGIACPLCKGEGRTPVSYTDHNGVHHDAKENPELFRSSRECKRCKGTGEKPVETSTIGNLTQHFNETANDPGPHN